MTKYSEWTTDEAEASKHEGWESKYAYFIDDSPDVRLYRWPIKPVVELVYCLSHYNSKHGNVYSEHSILDDATNLVIIITKHNGKVVGVEARLVDQDDQ